MGKILHLSHKKKKIWTNLLKSQFILSIYGILRSMMFPLPGFRALLQKILFWVVFPQRKSIGGTCLKTPEGQVCW